MTSLFLNKNLDIPNYQFLLMELKSFYLKRIPSEPSPFNHVDVTELLINCPITNIWLRENNLSLKVAALIITLPHKSHVDPHVDTQNNNLAINFPIENCEGCWTSLYKIIKGSTSQSTLPNGLTYVSFSEDAEFEEISKFTLESPVIFNTKIPHQVWNPTDKTRVSASLRFHKDPWWMI